MYLAVCDDNREELETVLSLLGCIPMNDCFDEPERMEFAETAALCVYYRGAYEGTGAAIRALTEYVRENSVQVTGPFHLPGGSAQLWGKQRGLYYAGRCARCVCAGNGQSMSGRLLPVSTRQNHGYGCRPLHSL